MSHCLLRWGYIRQPCNGWPDKVSKDVWKVKRGTYIKENKSQLMSAKKRRDRSGEEKKKDCNPLQKKKKKGGGKGNQTRRDRGGGNLRFRNLMGKE